MNSSLLFVSVAMNFMFGKNEYPEMGENFFNTYYDSKEKFSYIMMTLGNNIYEVDKYRKRMRYLPKIFEEYIMMIGDIHPHFVIYSSNRDVILEWYLVKYLSVILACGIVLINIALMQIIYHQRSSKKHKRSAKIQLEFPRSSEHME